MEQAVCNAVTTALAGDSGAGGVATLTSSRIYDTEGPQDAALPLVIVTGAAATPTQLFAAKTYTDYMIQCDVYASRFGGMAAARTIAERVLAVLNRSSLTATGLDMCKLDVSDGVRCTVEEDACRAMVTFIARTRK